MLTTRTRDVARSAYVGLPPNIRRSFGPLLRLLPLRYRFGKRYLTWREKIEAARLHPAHIPGLQRAALCDVIACAHDRSPFYRESLSPALAAAGSVGNLVAGKHWHDIPIIDGALVRRQGVRLCTRPVGELDFCSTGGSSGQPLSFHLDKDRSPVEYAFVMNAWSAIGYTADDWHAVFRGFTIPDPASTPFEVEDGLKELRFSVFHMTPALMPRYLHEIERRGIRFIKGYPSALAILAAFAVRQGIVNTSVRGILLHSEFTHAHWRRLLVSAFPNARVMGIYGQSEKCSFAIEDLVHPGNYDFDPLYGYTELVADDGEPVTTPGARGRIVSTGLLFKGTPFIRYDTGDEATLVALPAADNGYRLRVSRLTPRFTDEYIVTRSGDLVHVASLFMFDDELSVITDLQFEQFEPGIVHLRYVLREGADKAAVRAYERLVHAQTSGGIVLRTEVVERLPLSPRGKRPVIIQHLNTRQFGQSELTQNTLE